MMFLILANFFNRFLIALPVVCVVLGIPVVTEVSVFVALKLGQFHVAVGELH